MSLRLSTPSESRSAADVQTDPVIDPIGGEHRAARRRCLAQVDAHRDLSSSLEHTTIALTPMWSAMMAPWVPVTTVDRCERPPGPGHRGRGLHRRAAAAGASRTLRPHARSTSRPSPRRSRGRGVSSWTCSTTRRTGSELCGEVDTIVHCGMRPPPEPANYAAERVNLDMTARVYEVAAATASGGSSAPAPTRPPSGTSAPEKRGDDRVDPGGLSATGHLLRLGQDRVRDPRLPLRHRRDQPTDARCRSASSPPGRSGRRIRDRPLADYLRDIAGWISERDLQQLYVRSIEADTIADDSACRSRSSTGSATTPVPSGRSATPAGSSATSPGRLRDRVRRRHRQDARAPFRGTVPERPVRRPDPLTRSPVLTTRQALSVRVTQHRSGPGSSRTSKRSGAMAAAKPASRASFM